jgi:bifunctional non-homologous end joining protein LigD
MSGANAVLVAGVRLTSPDRVLYPEQGITKRELVAYYQAVADWLLPHLRGRPLTLVRCPAGREKHCFVQRRAEESFPATLRRVKLHVNGEPAEYLAAESLRGVISLVQLGTLELHTWGARRDRLDRPDRLVFDLDPGPAVAWPTVTAAAQEVRERLASLGLQCFVKTTGGRGLHVVAPLVRSVSWDEVKAIAERIARQMEEDSPAKFVSRAAKSERTERVFVDYLRNGWGASAIAAYSTRARAGAPVSQPLSWQELEGAGAPDEYTVRTVPERLRALGSPPWAAYWEVRQRITRATRRKLGLA